MGADDRANIIGEYLLYAVFFFQNTFQNLYILYAVAMADEHGVVCAGKAGLAHLLSQRFQGSLAASCFCHIDQLAFVVYMQHRLDLQHGANQCGSCADAAAPLQEHQVVNGEPHTQILLVFFHPVAQLFKTHTFVPLLAGIPHQQALAQGSAQGVDDPDLAIGIFFGKLGGGDYGGLMGGAETGGEGQNQSIIPCCQHGLNDLFPTLGVDGGSGGHITCAHAVIQLLQPFFAVLAHLFVLETDHQRNHGQVQIVIHIGGEIAAVIGNNAVRHSKSSL